MEHRIVVLPPSDTGGRVVRADGVVLGVAYRMAGAPEFLRRAGLDPDDVGVHARDLFDWRAGGPEMW
ncbi:hypothetical protein ABZZ36_30995 [Actinacidiphila glaucinigra]|uniref:hypothetical protein n=1 Tax=Actinacidiphila glaucinigra TaxID=235986 RepID=UPI0033B6A072